MNMQYEMPSFVFFYDYPCLLRTHTETLLWTSNTKIWFFAVEYLSFGLRHSKTEIHYKRLKYITQNDVAEIVFW